MDRVLARSVHTTVFVLKIGVWTKTSSVEIAISIPKLEFELFWFSISNRHMEFAISVWSRSRKRQSGGEPCFSEADHFNTEGPKPLPKPPGTVCYELSM